MTHQNAPQCSPLAQVCIERRSTDINMLQQIAGFNVVVDDRSGKGEGTLSALGRVRIRNVLDKRVELVDWVGVVIVVAIVVADRNVRDMKSISGVVVLISSEQRRDLPNEFLLGNAHSFRLNLVFNLVQGFALRVASGTLSIVDLLACIFEIGLQILDFRFESFDGIVELIEFVILEGKFRVLGGNIGILLGDGVFLRLDGVS